MPTPLDTAVMGPTDAHNGSGAVRQKLVKSPNDILTLWRPSGRHNRLRDRQPEEDRDERKLYVRKAGRRRFEVRSGEGWTQLKFAIIYFDFDTLLC